MQATDFSASPQRIVAKRQSAADPRPWPALQRALGITVSAIVCGRKGGGEKERKERPCPQPPPVHVLACLRVCILVLSDVFYLQVQEHTYLRVY